MSTPSVTIQEDDLRWNLPARGPVGMYCLIAAEVAIFTIFVVAYIFYIGKSLPDPNRGDVLHVPIFLTICLLSSSLTIHFAVRSLRSGKIVSFRSLVASDHRPGIDFSSGHASRVASPDLRRGLDHPD